MPGRVNSRSVILVVVLTLHAAVVAFILAAPMPSAGGAFERPVLLALLPPTKVPQVHAERVHTRPLRTDITVALAPPLLNSSADSASGAAPDGDGPSVNWTAEAHRALRAFEIRRDHPLRSAVSVSMCWDEWWSRAHRAGDQLKTENGDWIVWIDANCYQLASWHSNATMAGASAPRTLCRDRSEPRR